MEKYKMFEPKMNFYYPGVVPVSPGVPAGEAVEPAETTPTTTATKKVEPRTRKEYYLAAIAGEDVTIPEPKTRQEYYLKKIAENGGGSGGIFVVTIPRGTGTPDKTFEQVLTAYNAGLGIEAHVVGNNGTTIMPLSSVNKSGGEISDFEFSRITREFGLGDNYILKVEELWMYSEGDFDYLHGEYALTPYSS